MLTMRRKGLHMMNIGQFSYSTGLSVKTLRYYDDIGLLSAADVDEFNGYRSYRASQLQEAVLLRVLRASGMGVPEMKRALTHPHELEELIAQRQAELAVQRELEDWALTEAPRWREIDASEVKTRQRAAQQWVGVFLPFDLKDMNDDGEGDAAAEERSEHLETLAGRLFAEMSSRGLAPSEESDHRSWWMEFRSEPSRPSVVQVGYCIAVNEPVQPDFTVDGYEVVCGELPERVEAFITTEIPVEGDPSAAEAGPEGRLVGGPLPQRAGVALAVAAEDAGADPMRVRQQTRAADKRVVLDFSLTLPS